jgi:hypothetical protein
LSTARYTIPSTCVLVHSCLRKWCWT